MKISSRLMLTILAPVVLGLTVVGLSIFSYQTIQGSQASGTKVREIRDSITNLNSYVYSYLLYHEDRPKQQFTSEYRTLTQLISGIQIKNADQQALLDNIAQNGISINDTFLKLVTAHDSTVQTGNDSLDLEAEARLQGNLLIKSRDADVNASLLKQSIDDEIGAAQSRAAVLIVVVILLLSLPFTIILIRMRKHITFSLDHLRLGTEAVGAGNLSYRMELPGQDELSDLARSFDGMTGQLQAITVSRAALQEEVDERKKAENALRLSEQRWATTLASIGDAVIATDVYGRITFMNAVAESLTGWTFSDAANRPVAEVFNIINEYTRNKVENPVDKVLEAGLIVGLANHTLLVKRDGTESPIDDSGAPIRGQNGNPLGVVLIFRDITERKKTEEALQRYTRQLEISNKELESFSYTVSHDLRAPLRSLDGYSKALLEDYAGNLDEEGKKWLYNIRSSSQHMGRLIDDILGLSRVIRTDLKVEKIDLSDMARQVAIELKETEPERQVEFVIMPGAEVIGDNNLLSLVLQNLLGNSFKFTSGRRDARIEFGYNQPDGRKVFFVRDNGAGFDAKYSDKLFRPFQRLHNNNEYPGTGIGLVTVQRIVQRHGGKVWAEGEVNKGASFYFTLGEGRINT